MVEGERETLLEKGSPLPLKLPLSLPKTFHRVILRCPYSKNTGLATVPRKAGEWRQD